MIQDKKLSIYLMILDQNLDLKPFMKLKEQDLQILTPR